MKSTNFLLTAVCLSALALTSCKKEGCTDSTATNFNSEAKKDDGSCLFTNTPTTTVPVVTTPFTAKIDGVEFIETSVTGTLSSFSNTISIEAVMAGGKSVKINVPGNIATGSHTFGDPDLGAKGGYYNDGNSPYGAASNTGTFYIVSRTSPTIGNPGTISGTFSFTASPYAFSTGNASYVVSEGQFSVNYQ